ncbi:hypothetical protein TB1_032312 [Malus domestica]|nr:gamma-interferon-responsive lysosomal thiol protein-like [Malus domestica]
MASPKLFSLLILTSLLIVCVSCSSFEDQGSKVPPSPKSRKLIEAPSAIPRPPTKAKKVDLTLYYETLCPFCAQFIVNGLSKVFDTDLINIVNLRLVPYGNAHIQGPNSTIVCQHGPDECYLNSIEACAINSYPDATQHFKFIHCIENQTIQGKQSKDEWKSCSQQLGMDPKPVQDCYDSGLEKKLILQYANETAHLDPVHNYVPWVLVNTRPLYESYQNFVPIVCAAYKGSPKPEACKPLPPNINSTDKENSTGQRCYKGEEHQEQLKLRR